MRRRLMNPSVLPLLPVILSGGGCFFAALGPATPRPAIQPVVARPPLRTGEVTRVESLRRMTRRLVPLHKVNDPKEPGAWAQHVKEPGQSLDEYLLDDMRERVTAERRFLYLQPFGRFSGLDAVMLQRTAEFLHLFYQIPVRLCDPIPLAKIPESITYGKAPGVGRQLHVEAFLGKILRPALPADAAVLLAITTADLYPGRAWGVGYVYGTAWLYGRVGVISTSRLGSPHDGAEGQRQATLRLLKIASHEMGHAFSLRHTVGMVCGMNGRLGAAENERIPLWFSPEAVAKLCLATGADPILRYEALRDFCRANGFSREYRFYKASAEALRDPDVPLSKPH